MTTPRGIIVILGSKEAEAQALRLIERLERDMYLPLGSTVITVDDLQAMAELQKNDQTGLIAGIPENLIPVITDMANSLFLVNRWAGGEPPIFSMSGLKQQSDGHFSLPKVKSVQKAGWGRQNDARLTAPRLRCKIPKNQ